MSKRTEGNIGESNKTSVKVHYGPGGQSNWSLGWAEEEKPKTSSKNLSMKSISITTKAMLSLEVRTSKKMKKKRKDKSLKRRRNKKS